jgi:hypothetical protein
MQSILFRRVLRLLPLQKSLSVIQYTSPGVRMTSAQSALTLSQRALLPTDKFDDAAVNHISTLTESEIAPLVPELIEWLQDINWPVNHSILQLLKSHPRLAIEPVRAVLNGDDACWKSGCLLAVVQSFPRQVLVQLKPEMERIAMSPTEAEKMEDNDYDARIALKMMAETGEGESTREAADISR